MFGQPSIAVIAEAARQAAAVQARGDRMIHVPCGTRVLKLVSIPRDRKPIGFYYCPHCDKALPDEDGSDD